MLRKDLRNQIIPTTIDNSDENQKVGNKNFNTTDLIYLDSFEEQYQSQRIESNRRISPTDYTIMNNSYLYADTKKTVAANDDATTESCVKMYSGP